MDEVSITLAHELGQPITGLLLDINMIRLHCQKLGMADTETVGFINSLEKHALRAREIIGAIRGFVKSETVAFEPVDVCTVVRDVMALFNTAVLENQVRFDAQLARRQAWIDGHGVLLSLVFHNLFRNAMQASAAGAAAHVTVTVTEQDKQLEVLIEDNGSGFSDETLTQVGERGFTTKQDGMGVGLALCRRIIEQHRATMTLANRDNGQGACIRLVFPSASPGDI
jgi:signal transduction histidine kinase